MHRTLTRLSALFLCVFSLAAAAQEASTSDELARQLEAIRSPDAKVRRSAVHELLRIREKEALDAVIEALRDPDPEVRGLAAQGLPARDLETSLPAIIQIFQSADPEARLAAAVVLAGQRTPESDATVPVLLEALRHQHAETRELAFEALGSLGPQGKPAVPALIELLQGQDALLRSAAIVAVSRIGPEARAAVPALIEILRGAPSKAGSAAAAEVATPNPRIGPASGSPPPQAAAGTWVHVDRARSAEALGRIGADARDAVPALVEALQAEDQRLRQSAAEALGSIGPDARPAIPALVDALDAPDAPAISLIRALGKFGSEARPAIPKLVLALQSPEVQVRATAADALGNIGPEASAAIPALLELVRRQPQPAGAEAASTAGAEAAPTADAKADPKRAQAAKVSKFQKVMQDQQKTLDRSAAIKALGKIGAQPKDVIPALLAVLEEESQQLRREAAKALRELGPEGQAALQNSGYSE